MHCTVYINGPQQLLLEPQDTKKNPNGGVMR